MKINFLALNLLFLHSNIYTCEVVVVFVKQSILSPCDTPYQEHITKINRAFSSRRDAIKFISDLHSLNQCTQKAAGGYSLVPPFKAIQDISRFINLSPKEAKLISATGEAPYLVYIEQLKNKK